MTAARWFHAQEKATGFPGSRFLRYLGPIRYREVLVLQGSPLLGAALAMRGVTESSLARLAILTVANLLLVAHVFALNDWSGMAELTSLGDPACVIASSGFSRVEMGWLSIALLIPSLVLFGIIGLPGLLIALAIAVLSFAYSAPALHAKGIPVLSSVIHLCGGILHFLLGYSLFTAIDERGIAIGFFFALSFVAGHLTHEVRDYDGDRLNGIKTNAVVFGKSPAFIASLVIFTVAYVQIVVLALRGVLPIAMAAGLGLYPLHLYWSMQAIAEGLTSASVRQLQARYRALFAVIGIWMIGTLLIERCAISHSQRSDPQVSHSRQARGGLFSIHPIDESLPSAWRAMSNYALWVNRFDPIQNSFGASLPRIT